MTHRCVWSHVLTVTACCMLAANASADVVSLYNGGQVRGTVQTADDAPVVVIQTLLGGKISIEQSEIGAIEHRSPLVEEYESRARDVANTVEARWSLAEWCHDNRLKEQREEQLSLLLMIDPNHADAHKGLGHVRHNSKWLTRDEWMTSRGYVLHEGKYVTQQERARLQLAEEMRGVNAEWFPKVRVWFNSMVGGNPQQAAESRAQFQALTDPDATAAVAHFFGRHSDGNVRMMGVKLLGQMPGPKPVEPLVCLSIYDGEHDIRVAARGAIQPEQRRLAQELYVRELQKAAAYADGESNRLVRRAAVGMGEVGDMSAVPALVWALATRRYIVMQTLSTKARGTYAVIYLPPGSEPDPHIGAHYHPCQTECVANPEVLDALKKITGQDFGFDKRAWAAWWREQGNYPITVTPCPCPDPYRPPMLVDRRDERLK
ncbi:MAG: hypothetical protein U0992_11195 [Planctomycetaceae bacterium]